MKKNRSEFDLISDFFSPLAKNTGSLKLLDDVALINVDKTKDLVVSTDMLISGVHFFSSDLPGEVAAKSIRVNISDIITKGAIPKYYFLSIALPSNIDDNWINLFSKALKIEQKKFDVSLMGGDTVSTKGPLTINIVCMGEVKKNKLVKRSTAQIGDNIYVTGYVGEAKIGLEIIKGKFFEDIKNRDYFIKRYKYPTPRFYLANELANFASSSIDISDGLLSDLRHICFASNVKGNINVNLLPLSKQIKNIDLPEKFFFEMILNGGDDYEILFTSNPRHEVKINNLSEQLDFPITKIGYIEKGKGIEVFDYNNQKIEIKIAGYVHR